MNAKTATFALLGLAALLLGLLLLPAGAPENAPSVASAGEAATEKSRSPSDDSAPDLPESVSKKGTLPPSGIKTAVGAAASEGAAGSGRQRELRLARLAARLAALPPDQALAQIAALPDQESRDIAMLELLSEWTGASSLEIIRSGDVWRFGAGGALAVHLLESGKITPEQAAAMSRQNTDGNRRGELYARIGAQLAATDPAAAVAMGNDLEGWGRRRFLESLAGRWSANSPEEAKRWISSVADPDTRDGLLAGLLETETRRNPAAAAAMLAALPMSDASSGARAVSRIASEWASKDTIAAMQWSSTLTDQVQRSAAEQGIRGAAPVGVGAMLTRGAEGLPVVGNVVPGSPAAASGALQSGDTVVAVTDASGAWVDAGKVSQRELIGMVRGQPNTQVSLQVRSAGSSATRVVTLGRQQIIFRPQ